MRTTPIKTNCRATIGILNYCLIDFIMNTSLPDLYDDNFISNLKSSDNLLLDHCQTWFNQSFRIHIANNKSEKQHKFLTFYSIRWLQVICEGRGKFSGKIHLSQLIWVEALKVVVCKWFWFHEWFPNDKND